MTSPTYLINAGLLTVAFQSALPPGQAWTWFAFSFVVNSAWLASAWILRRPSTAAQTWGVTLLMAGFALVVSLQSSWLLWTTFPVVDEPGRLALIGFSVALLCLGTTVLSTLPLAAWSWIAGLLVGVAFTLIVNGDDMVPASWFMLFTLAAVLVLLVSVYHRLFVGRIQAEIQAANQSQLVNLLLHDFEEGSQDWLWETDLNGCLRNVSPRLARQLERPASELEGQSLVSLLVPDPSNLTIEEEEDLATLTTFLEGKKPFRDCEVPVEIGEQHRRWRLAAKPLVVPSGEMQGWRGVGTDITEVQRLHTVNARLALLDSLTGMANRYRLQTVLHDHLSPRSGGRPCSLILLDLENFRMVNEGMGHEVGDHLLQEVAQRLRTRVPGSSLLARFGGDEFALMAPGAGDEALESLIAALRSTSDEPFLIEGHRLEVTYLIGAATAPRDAQTAMELLKCAELALHEAKLQRQDRTVAYRPELGKRALDRMRLRAELKVALIESQFELHYQPQIRISDGALVGCEALVRWRHPQRGMVSPAEFIPALEETGLIVPVGIWILEMACREALTWPDDQTVAVNVSAVQFASRTFLDSVHGVLTATGLPARRLELEITESVMAQDPKQVVQILQDMRNLGISIALDDFGTGYSSLSYLRLLPLDKLKVDQSFVRVLGQDPNAASIVQTVLELSRQLGLKTTAEGVEQNEQQDQLRTMGCDTIQGYLYSKPLTPEALHAFRNTRQPANT